MHDVNQLIAEHYTCGTLYERFREGLKRSGVDPDAPGFDDLAGGDEFHVGGIEATRALLGQLGIVPDMHVLDIGSGVGGPARVAAHDYGCRATGVDLTPEFVATAKRLTGLVGMEDRVSFEVGSGTDLPLADASVDVAFMLHVGMNIADKGALFREAARVLKPGGAFGIYDVMTGPSPGPLTFPLPWASVEETSFVGAPDDYKASADGAGLTLVAERDRREYGVAFMRKMMERARAEGPPPIGPHLFMGESARERLSNATGDLAAGRIATVELIFRTPA